MQKFRILFISILLVSGYQASAQIPDTLRACLDSAMAQAKATSLYRNTVNWETIEAEVAAQSQLAQNVLDLRPALSYLLGQLHDSHGRFFFQSRPIAWYHGDPEGHQQHIDPKIWSVIQSGKYPFQYAMLPNNTGYLRLTGMPMGNNAQLASPIQAAVCSLQNLGARQWVIDLRYNGGGNMFPMLAGVAHILGDGDIGGSMEASGTRLSTWKIEDGDVFYNDMLNADMVNRCPIPDTPKVAVLCSRYTVSSGEVVAVAFKGRSNTRFIGEHTAGFVTETSWVPLPAGVTMSLSVSYFADRDGRVYTRFVPVDDEVEFIPDQAPEADEAIRKALEWMER